MSHRTEVVRFRPRARTYSHQFSPDGKYFAWIQAAALASFEMICVEVATGQTLFRRPARSHFHGLAWAGPSLLACWETPQKTKFDRTSPWSVLLLSIPDGEIAARIPLPAEAAPPDNLVLSGAATAPRVLAGIANREGTSEESRRTPLSAFLIDGAAKKIVHTFSLKQALQAPEHEGFYTSWQLNPTGTHVVAASYIGNHPRADRFHILGLEGITNERTITSYTNIDWLDAETVMLRPTEQTNETLLVDKIAAKAPLLHEVVSGTPFLRGSISARELIFLDGHREFMVRSFDGSQRSLGALIGQPYGSARHSMHAIFKEQWRVLQGSARPIPAAKRVNIPGHEEGTPPPTTGIYLSDACTDASVLLHGVSKLYTKDLHKEVYPVALVADPTEQSIAVLVRVQDKYGKLTVCVDELLLCDLPALTARFELPKKSAKRTKPATS